jgi:hypothetical protein
MAEMLNFTGCAAPRDYREGASQGAQERDQIRLFLWRQDQAKASLVKMHDVQQALSGAIMEVRRAGGEPAKDWPFDFANVIESPIDQCLAEIGRGLANTCGLT